MLSFIIMPNNVDIHGKNQKRIIHNLALSLACEVYLLFLILLLIVSNRC